MLRSAVVEIDGAGVTEIESYKLGFDFIGCRVFQCIVVTSEPIHAFLEKLVKSILSTIFSPSNWLFCHHTGSIVETNVSGDKGSHPVSMSMLSILGKESAEQGFKPTPSVLNS